MDERLRECLPGHELSFDESRMFELLQYVRALPKYRDVPVICVYGDHLNLSDVVIRNIDVAVKALGGSAFLDLRDGSFAYPGDCAELGTLAAQQGSFLTRN